LVLILPPTVDPEGSGVDVVRTAVMAKDLAAHPAVVASPEHGEGAVAPVADPAHLIL